MKRYRLATALFGAALVIGVTGGRHQPWRMGPLMVATPTRPA